MKPAELLAAIDSIRNTLITDIKGRIEIQTHNSFFIVIDKDNSVRRSSNVSFIYSGDFKFAIMIVDYGFITQPWYKNNWEFAGFITPDNIISKIEGIRWSIEDVWFDFTRYGSMAPIFIINLNSEANKVIKYLTTPDGFDHAWKFFEEINEECDSLDSAIFYQRYFKERLTKEDQQLKIEQYKLQISSKNNIIEQYKELIDLIEQKVKVN